LGSWDFQTTLDFEVVTKSMTDWGPLTTYINFTSTSNETSDVSADIDSDEGPLRVEADEYWFSLGPVLFGRAGSAFDIVGDGYTWGGPRDFSDDKADQVQLSWALNGFGLTLALEDPRDRWGSASTNEMPDLVAAISAGGTGWDAAVSFLYADLVYDTQVAVQGNVEFDVWGNSLQLGALWADNGGNGSIGGSSLATEDGWAFLASYQHNFSEKLWAAATFNYVDDNVAGDGWIGEFTVAFSPASGMWLGGNVAYNDTSDSWAAFLFAERTWGTKEK
jgi:hypothetical protein